jgi:hypothetical protein
MPPTLPPPQTNLPLIGKKRLKKKKNVVNKFYVLAIYPGKPLFYSWKRRQGGTQSSMNQLIKSNACCIIAAGIEGK